MPAFYLLNLGCAKNLVEGEHLAGMLLARGMEAAEDPAGAQWLVVNTCGFIRPAVDEAIDAILELAEGRAPGQRLAVVGCLVGRYGRKLARALPEVDLFVAPGALPRLADLLHSPPSEPVVMAPPRALFTANDPRAVTTGPGWAYLRVADGCLHRCAFCTIPAIRGPLRSRPVADILAEAEALAASGVVELNLVAQDLASYGADLGGPGLTELLPRLAAVEGIRWVRALYLHPDVLDQRLIDVLCSTPGVLPYFDIPIQHVADQVLRAMGRRRSGAELRALIRGIRAQCPGATLRTTLLLGHPGEGPAQFAEALAAVDELEFDHLGAFAYCPEAGTRAARQEAAPPEEAARRRRLIMKAQEKVSRRRLALQKGTEQELLFLGTHPDHELVRWGRLASQAPEADGDTIVTDGDAAPGNIVRCRITKCHSYDLESVIS